MSIEKLKKQQAELAEKIAQAEAVEKNKSRVEKLVLKILAKHPELFIVDAKSLEESLTEAFSAVSKKFTSSKN